MTRPSYLIARPCYRLDSAVIKFITNLVGALFKVQYSFKVLIDFDNALQLFLSFTEGYQPLRLRFQSRACNRRKADWRKFHQAS